MKKIKDRIILGIIGGTIASVLGQIINVIEYKKKVTDVSYSQAASKLFLDKRKSTTNSGQVLSLIINLINSCVFTGIPITYLLSVTGKDKAIFKSIGVWLTQWVFISGFLSKTFINVKTRKPISPYLSLFDHILMGALNGFIVTKFGDDSLFPDRNVKKGEKLPLIAINQQAVNES